MKKRYIAVTLGIILSAATAFAGCGSSGSSSVTSSSAAEAVSASSASDSAASSSEETAASDTIYGEVESVSGDTVTINVGTKEDDSSDLTLTGETKEITVTDDTKYEMEQNNGGGQQPPEMPSDSGNSDSSDSSQATDSSAQNGDSSENSSNNQAGPGGQQPPEMPSDSGNSDSDGNSQQPPEMPSDSGNSDSSDSSQASDGNSSDSSSASSDGSQPSGSGDSQAQQPPEMPSGNGQNGQGGPGADLSLDSLSEGTQISVTFDSDGNAETITILGGSGMQGGPGEGQGGPGGGQSSADVTYTSDNEISSDSTLSDTTIDSTGTDEEAVLVDGGATATLKNLTINRDSDDSTGGDNSSFYGVGASVLTTDGTTYLSDSTITSDAKGGAGVFSYGDNSTVYVSDTDISTSQDTSGGIHVAGGGTLYAYDVTAETAGESSAAIRSDRGGGTIVADGGSYTSNGTGSPAIYSTADITVKDADLTANNSEAICIEGLNTIRLYDCDLTGNMPDNDQNDCTWNVILYQSMSGDSEEGNSTFEMSGGTLTAKNGGMFYTTNTESTFVLDNVKINYADENDFFLKVTGNSNQRGWGESGSNGADSKFTAIDQEMEGDVIWDSVSQLDFYMTGSSSLTGAVIDDESNAGNGGDGYCNFYIEKGSTWTVTGDSTLTNLYNEGTIADADGNTVTIKGTDGTVYVQGTSEYTVTVSSYSDTADTSDASTIDSWSDYEVAKPSELG